MKNKTYPFYRLVLPNFLLTVFSYWLFLLGFSVEVLIWLIVGYLFPLIVMAMLCARYGLLKYQSSARVLLKIVFCINIPFLVIVVFLLSGDWGDPKVWLFAVGFFILGCVKDFLLTFIFLPKEACLQIIQKRYPILLVLIMSILISFITPVPDYSQRTYVAEGLALATGAKLASVEFYDEHKRFPKDNTEAGLLKPEKITGQVVKSVEIKPDGIIEIIYNAKLKDNAILKIKAVVDQDKVTWKCAKNEDFEISLVPKDLPFNCRNQIYGNEDR